MPVITLDSSTLSKEQKQRLISELTSVAARITNIPESAFVVFLNEHNRDNIGSSGKQLSEAGNLFSMESRELP